MSKLQNRSINLTQKKDQISFDFQTRKNFEKILQGKYITRERILANSSDGSNETIRIEKLLGKGGYGEVYQVCYINKPDKNFALKIPRDPLDITKSYIENEIQKLGALQRNGSKYIPKIKAFYFFWGQEKIPCYLTHIYKPIQHVFPNFLNNAPINPIHTLTLFYLVTLGLKHITSHHIVHNDIKPENIMFYGETPIITDYGTARSNSEINEVEIERICGRLHGTPTWLPPELISVYKNEIGVPYVYYNLAKVCPKTDTWGLGLILMKFLTGKNLFPTFSQETFSSPDVFLKIKNLFTEENILDRYKNWSKRYINRIYKGNKYSKENNLDIEYIRHLLGSQKDLFDTKKEPDKISRSASSGRFQSAKLLIKKLDLLSRKRSDIEIRDFFIESLFDIADMCTDTLDNRVKVYRLVNILEQIFPGLKEIDSKLSVPDLGNIIIPDE